MVSVAGLASRFSATEEFALIDPREVGAFSRGHILGSTNAPLSRIEIDIPLLVPCRQCEIILAADNASLIDRTRSRLEELGYENVHELEGGIDAWALAGFVLFSGVNVVSKSFGEYVEANLETPHIDAKELRSWMQEKREHILLDGRTPHEHRSFCIPGAMHCANGDLPVIAGELASNPDVPVVVHCAGRTRSIIGAQVLIDSAIPNPVYALKNGTLDWQYEGLELERDANRPFPKPDCQKLDSIQKHAAARAENFGIKPVSRDQLDGWNSCRPTTYIFDIRSSHEYKSGSLAKARNVPGGQLAQSTDSFIGVRNSRIVLCDDDGVRALYAAIWLKRMGWRNIHTHTMEEPMNLPAARQQQGTKVQTVTAPALKQELDSHSVTVLDLRRSIKYQRGHIPGAHYVSRHQAEYLNRIPGTSSVALVGDDPGYCALVAEDCTSAGLQARMLEGGMRAWRDSGFEIESTRHSYLCQPLDAYLDPGDFADPILDTREGRRYLNWEIELADLLEREPAAMFTT